METKRRSKAEAVVAGTVFVHLGVSIVHETAHVNANVGLSLAAMAFVFGVIGAGPVLGLALQWFVAPRAGAWVVAATLTAAFVFGAVSHFVLPGPDSVSEVAGPWRTTFVVTAVLLAITEAFGSLLAARCATAARRSTCATDDGGSR